MDYRSDAIFDRDRWKRSSTDSTFLRNLLLIINNVAYSLQSSQILLLVYVVVHSQHGKVIRIDV
jgi:hypothetical protein